MTIVSDMGNWMAIITYNNNCLTAPEFQSDNVTINEDEGAAVLTVTILNEIENDFVLDYRTEEVPGGAEGILSLTFTILYNNAFSLQRTKILRE